MVKPRGRPARARSRLRPVAGSTARGRPRAAPGRTTGSGDDGPQPAVEVEEPAPRSLLLRVRGAFDDAVDGELTRVLGDRLGSPVVSRVVIDLAGVTTLTSAGVRALHRLHRECRLAGRHLVFVGTANPAVHRYLHLSGLLPLVDARPTIQAALRVHPSFPPHA
jgi:anti-anti-sigma factor